MFLFLMNDIFKNSNEKHMQNISCTKIILIIFIFCFFKVKTSVASLRSKGIPFMNWICFKCFGIRTLHKDVKRCILWYSTFTCSFETIHSKTHMTNHILFQKNTTTMPLGNILTDVQDYFTLYTELNFQQRYAVFLHHTQVMFWHYLVKNAIIQDHHMLPPCLKWHNKNCDPADLRLFTEWHSTSNMARNCQDGYFPPGVCQLLLHRMSLNVCHQPLSNIQKTSLLKRCTRIRNQHSQPRYDDWLCSAHKKR